MASRFDRHRVLVGDSGLEALQRARVAVCGAGGLGSTLLQLLARLGLGHITIFDPGVVDTPDLNRQILYTAKDLGSEKAVAAAELLNTLGEDLVVEARGERASASTDFSEFDLVVDCLDSFRARFGIDEATYDRGIPLVHAGVYRHFGQVIAVHRDKSPSLRHLFPGSTQRVDEEPGKPMFPPAVVTVASIQASQCLAILTKNENSISWGELITVDLLHYEMDVVPLKS